MKLERSLGLEILVAPAPPDNPLDLSQPEAVDGNQKLGTTRITL